MRDDDKLTEAFEDHFCHELVISKEDALFIASDLTTRCIFGNENKSCISLIITVTEDKFRSAMYPQSKISRVIGILTMNEVKPKRLPDSFEPTRYQKQLDSIIRILDDI